MSKKILFCIIFILIFLIPSKQDPNAKTWERYNTTAGAESILAAIERGDSIIIDRCEILGPLIKEGTPERPDTIKSFIDICFSVFSDSVSFEYCYFMEQVLFFEDTLKEFASFTGTIFGGGGDFWDTTFGGYTLIVDRGFDGCASFTGTTFGRGADFLGTTFNRAANFSSTTFDTTAHFNQAKFHRDVDFDGTTFGREAYFWRTTFGRDADFKGTTFGSDGFFLAATFHGDADFRSATFDTTAYFSDVTFVADADFEGTTFVQDAYFDDATFRGEADFKATTVHRTAYFSDATFGEDANFRDAIFSGYAGFDSATFTGDAHFGETVFGGDADFTDAIFGGKVDLSPIEFKDIYISWKQLKGRLVYNRTANYNLMKHFEDKRQLEDADGIYLFLKDNERMEMPNKLQRYLEYWFIQLTCGYGVKPLNTLYLSAAIILLFALFYTHRNAIKEIEAEFRYRRPRRRYKVVRESFGKRLYDALYFSVHTFIIGVVSDLHPTDEFLIETKKIRLFKFRTLSMIEGALGWILLVLFVVTLTRKFIR